MKQRRTGIIILFAILAMLVFLYFLYADDEKRYQWFENYRAESDQPYGTKFLRDLLEGYRPGQNFIYSKRPLKNILKDIDNPSGFDYVFVGQRLFLDEDSKGALIKFLDRGGNAFISSITPPDEILQSVYYQECGVPVSLSANHIESVKLNFFRDGIKVAREVEYAFRFMAEDHAYNWDFYDDGLFCDSTRSIVPLGFQDEGNVNFIRIPAGRGNLYLHSNPLVFTNYFLTHPEKLDYLSGVFSHLDGKDIIWDEYSKVPALMGNNGFDSPLYYIMQQPSLKYAWWLLLISVLLYVLFGGKRRQRVMAVLEGKSNTSLAFVNLISRLYFKNGNHLDMAHKKMKYFLYFVRSRYGIHAEGFGAEQIRKLSEKSKVRLADVEVIFMQYGLIEEKFKDNIDAGRLVNLYDVIDNFYKQCK